jgi:virginiamycin B lyase
MTLRSRTRRALLAPAATAVLAAVLCAPAGAQVVERRDSVEGTAYVAPPCSPAPGCSEQPRYRFHVVTEADGSRPQGSILFSVGERATVYTISGSVTCARIEGARATVAANLTEADGSGVLSPRSVLVHLEDNGAAGADRYLVRTLPLGTAPSRCPAAPPPGATLAPTFADVTIVDRMPGPRLRAQCRRGGWVRFGFASRQECVDFVIRTRALAGSIRELPIPTPRTGPVDIAAGPDGALWFTEPNADAIGRVTTAGRFREFPLPHPSSYPTRITAGPDGAMWFVEALGHRIGRIDRTGAVTELPTPTQGSFHDLTAGPDGALWLTASEFPLPRRIVRMTTAGAASGFPIGDEGNYTQDITSGPDGALWFTHPLFGVGRLTTDGRLTRYATPTGAFGITPGPGGALWFTSIRGSAIGRITTSGQVTTLPYPPGPAGGNAASIAAGADGALWFTLDGDRIGRMTPGGAFTAFPLPTLDATPTAIAAGPDGALWFTERVANRIGRIPARPRNRGSCHRLGWARLGFSGRAACVAFVRYVPPA